MEYVAGTKLLFYKLYFGPARLQPPGRIYLYYQGRPLYSPAVFSKDRYTFALPRYLDEKMLAGKMFADYNYADPPRGFFFDGRRVKIPESIVLSDRCESRMRY